MNYQEYFEETLTFIEKELVLFYKAIFEEKQPQKILEIGSGWGIFTRTALEYSKAQVTTIDLIAPENMKDFSKAIEGADTSRLKIITGDSKIIVPKIEDKFDLILVDGDHTYQGVPDDLKNSLAHLNPKGVMLIDDVFHANNWRVQDEDFRFGVTRAFWEFIKENRLEAKVYPLVLGLARIDRK